MTHPTPATGAAQPAAPPPMPDLATITAREIAHSYRGDAGTGSPLETVGQDLRAALGLRPGQHVLDVAAGNGRVTLAARHWCAATPKTAAGLALTFEDADVEALPFADHSFDAVASTFGTTFATNQDQAAAELLRVCKRGGKIGLTSWTPDGFIGQLIKTIARHVPPPAGAKSPSLWGVRPRIEEMFGFQVSPIRCEARTFNFHYRSRLHWLDAFRTHYAPVVNAFAALPARGQSALAADLLALADRFNCADVTMVAPADYLEIVMTTR
jgi:SAM-dependent methyltransferase